MTNKSKYFIKLLFIFSICIFIFSGCDSNKKNNKVYGEYLFKKYTEITNENLKSINTLNTADLEVFQGNWAKFEKLKKDISESYNKAEDKDPKLDLMKTEILKYVEENINLWMRCSFMASSSRLQRGLFLFMVPDEVKKQIDVVTESMAVSGKIVTEIVLKYDIDISELEKLIKK